MGLPNFTHINAHIRNWYMEIKCNGKVYFVCKDIFYYKRKKKIPDNLNYSRSFIKIKSENTINKLRKKHNFTKKLKSIIDLVDEKRIERIEKENIYIVSKYEKEFPKNSTFQFNTKYGGVLRLKVSHIIAEDGKAYVKATTSTNRFEVERCLSIYDLRTKNSKE